jgi:hypothetical protein
MTTNSNRKGFDIVDRIFLITRHIADATKGINIGRDVISSSACNSTTTQLPHPIDMTIPSFLTVLAVSAAMLAGVQAEQHEVVFVNK